jgi:predicted amidohydrolase
MPDRDEVFVVHATVITGDGTTTLPDATVHIVDGTIIDVDQHVDPPSDLRVAGGARVIDAEGGLVIPGVVNGHAHGCSTGPLFSSGASPLDARQALTNAQRHLEAGVTTLVNVCGFADNADIAALEAHALRLFLSTTAFAEAFAAADIVDGAGLTATPRQLTAAGMLDDGAVAIGEVGSGATLGGGVAAYRYVPAAVRRLSGHEIDPDQAGALIDARLGPRRNPDDGDPVRFRRVIAELGLLRGPGDDRGADDRGRADDDADTEPAGTDTEADDALVAALDEAVLRYAYLPLRHSLDTFAAAAQLSARAGVPAVFHTAAPSVDRLIDVARDPSAAGATLVAGHMNHPSIGLEAAVAKARVLRDLGVIIDVSVLDSVTTRRLVGPEIGDALVAAGLVDTISTDYAGGHSDSMLDGVQRWWRTGTVSLAAGVRMATTRPAELFARAADRRGLIAPGHAADLAICDEFNVARVHTVLIDGRVVVDETARALTAAVRPAP